ncbi:hypothetical protein V8E54_007365 [Elaphomyces granulatus]
MSGSVTPPLPLHNVPLSRASPMPSGTRSNGLPSATWKFSQLDPQQTADDLGTSLVNGLTPVEADVRLRRDGPNELPHEEPEPWWLRFLKQFRETLILLLLASAAISFLMGNFDDAISITLAVTIVVTVGFVQEYRSEKSLEALNRLVPHYAHLIRNVPTADRHNSKRSSSPGEEYELQDWKLAGSSQGLAATTTAATTVPAAHLVPGDLVLFGTGDRIPADIRIIAVTDLSIDESNLTGENEPVCKSSDPLRPTLHRYKQEPPSPESPRYEISAAGTVGADVRLNEQRNIAFMGTLVRSGYGQGIVIATGPNTEFGSISTSLHEIESPRTPLQLSMDRLGQELSYMSFAVIGLIVVIGLLQGRKILEMFTIGVSLAVAAIPEGLPIIVTVTLALGVLRMAKRGAIMRRLPSVETLGSVNVVCSDKTGTLTMNHMTVTKMWYFDGPEPFDVQITDRVPWTVGMGPAVRKILRVGNIANNARLSRVDANSPACASSAAVLSSTADSASGAVKSRWVGQPTDVAILDLLDLWGEEDLRDHLGPRIAETPFSSERKWMGVIMGGGGFPGDAPAMPATPGGGGTPNAMAYIKGALEPVLLRCDTYLTKDGREVILDEPRRQVARQAADQMAGCGLRVLAFAYGSVPIREPSRGAATLLGTKSRSPSPKRGERNGDERFSGLVFAGLVGMNDPPRKDVHQSIRRLMAGGVKVVMITGDSEATAVAIARRLGMTVDEEHSVLRGDQIDQMSMGDLAAVISTTTIFARTTPEHKMKIVYAFQSRGDVVAMTGDGVNDAPALKKADIGISMGKLGTDVAKEAADMILTDDDFSTILRAIEQGKGIFYNIQNFITFQLSTSVAALSLVLLSTTLGFKNPLNAMQILWINILMDGPPAQSLGVEPVDPSIMTRPPRPRAARVLTRSLIQRVLTSAALIMLGTLIVYIREMGEVVEDVSIDKHSRVVTAHDTTMTFTCFVLFDMWNALTCRSEGKSVLRGELSLFSNRMFNYAVLGSLAGQASVIYLPLLQRIFQTEALRPSDLVKLFCISSTVFWVDEGRKFLRSLKKRRSIGAGYSVNV